MRDYAEIAHNLRCCGVDVPCDDCTYQDDIVKCGSLERQAADAIEELLARDVVPTDFHERCLQLEIRKRIELEKQMPHWISVEDELPEIGKSVLLFNGAVHIGWRVDGKRFRFLSERFPDHPTHWMPLPKAPKEVE